MQFWMETASVRISQACGRMANVEVSNPLSFYNTIQLNIIYMLLQRKKYITNIHESNGNDRLGIKWKKKLTIVLDF